MAQERPVDPMVSEHRLLLELRAAREASGLSQREVADRLDWSLSKVIRIETGAVGVSITDVQALLALYGFEQPDADRLLAMARAVRVGRRRQVPDAIASLSRDFRLFMAYEGSATRMRHFNPLLIPGLFQTEDYARALLDGGFVHRPTRIDDKVTIRLRRQQLLQRRDPPQVEVILDEAAIRRPVGGTEVMSAQLRSLLELGRRPNISLRVLPFAAGLYPGIFGPFVLLDFEQPLAMPVLYLEASATDTTLRHDPEAVLPYRQTFDRLSRQSLDAAGSVRLVESAIADLSSGSVAVDSG